jgi:hypothetical protein
MRRETTSQLDEERRARRKAEHKLWKVCALIGVAVGELLFL